MHTSITFLRRPLSAALAVATTGALLAGCGGGGSVTLNGAGASFPAAIYQRWFQELATKGAQVNYQSVGSGAGVRQFIAGTVDFGASDVPMKADEIAQVSRGVLQIPMTAGAIAVAYNNPGCELKLSQAQLVDIFLGKIKDFSDVGCEAKPIKVVHRSDGSGTTANFTAHLAAISPAWKDGPGVGKTVNWPLGIGAKGNEGVSAQLSQVDGGIGYVEVAYVKGDLQAAALTNSSGETLKPTTESETTALASIELGPDLIGSNPNPDKGYPIVTFSWILLYKSGNADKLDGIKKVFDFTLSEGAQAMAPELGYVPLPPSVLEKGRERLATLEK
ncbi:phosphate ABC transporter substrate-binding protein PstS [Cyanobium gracile]|uniref:Phosphate-binding protein n=1 Tax=Cyanobium gracile UHCC 0281 TaxID=3110309 RepID=A0ABU5SV55_9CYAN|nr:phosphate ABC transporter substrate-binding protein PstS [Cyanobium gracile]MEA5442395.1 phosphate ABC transporter substrate-binding protein PstS [Cyanobium gracile UHCC 0281]